MFETSRANLEHLNDGHCKCRQQLVVLALRPTAPYAPPSSSAGLVLILLGFAHDAYRLGKHGVRGFAHGMPL